MKPLDRFTRKALVKKHPILAHVETFLQLSNEDTISFGQAALKVDTTWQQEDPTDVPNPTLLLSMSACIDFPFASIVSVEQPLTTADVLETDATELFLVSRTKDGWLITEYTGVSDVVTELLQLGERNAENILESSSY